MLLQSRRLGIVEYNPADVITFPQGIPAFEELHRFLVVAPPQSAPILFLQSIEDPALSLPLIEAIRIMPSYEPSLSPDDMATLGGCDAPSLEVYVVLALFESHATANLVAPVMVHHQLRLGAQAVRADRVYSAVHPVTFLDPVFTPC